MQSPVETTYQFGSFEVRAASGELFRQGRRVRLQEQPFRLLLVLLERPGQVVTREELKTRIWEETTFVDFDSSLRVAVRKLRDALGDDADTPQYVETIPKRGYRFLAEVSRVGEPVQQSPGGVAVGGSNANWFRRWAYALAGLALVAAGLFTLRYAARPHTPLSEKDTVVLADFTNSTGDPLFDETLRQGMEVQLEQSPFLNLISQARIQQTLSLMGRVADSRITPELAADICQRTGSTAVLSGSIAGLGSAYVLGLRASDCHSGNVLADEQVQAAKKEDVLDALGGAASKLRARLGESLSTIEKHNTPLAEASTPSLEALKAYSAGERVHYSVGSAAEIPFLKRAIEIDPNFTMAYAMLGRVTGDLGEADASAQYTTRAYQLRSHVSDWEKFFIAVAYDLQVTGNLEMARQDCQAWIQAYPRFAGSHALMAGEIEEVPGKFAEGVELANAAVDLDPDFPFGYLSLAYDYEYQDQYDQAEKVLDRAAARKLDLPDFLTQRYDLAFLQGDETKMQRIASLGEKDSLAEGWILDHEGFVLAYSGRLQQALAVTRRASGLARQQGESEKAALFQTGAALWQALFGDAPAARRSALEVLKLSHNRDVEYGAALALAFSGDYLHSLRLTNDLEQRFPEDTSVKFSYLPALRALQALSRHQPARAIAILQTAAPYDLGAPRSSIYGFFGAMYPVYVRGEAYLAAHQGVAAAGEFEKIVRHRGIVVSDPIAVVAQVQLARAYAMAGDIPRARSEYQAFLKSWSEADSSIPIMQQTQYEYARLR